MIPDSSRQARKEPLPIDTHCIFPGITHTQGGLLERKHNREEQKSPGESMVCVSAQNGGPTCAMHLDTNAFCNPNKCLGGVDCNASLSHVDLRWPGTVPPSS